MRPAIMHKFAALFSFLIFLVPAVAHGGTLTFVTDLISTSMPSATTTTHTIRFTATHAIPASGTIVITPQAGGFTIPADFDVNDVDFLVNSSGSYVDRTIDTVDGVATDGVTIVSGTSGSIRIKLSSGAGIQVGDRIMILLGTNAVSQAQGIHSITNPSTPASYRIRIDTLDQSDAPMDSASAMVAIVRQVTILIRPEAVAPLRFAGLPAGSIPSRSSSIEISLQTDQRATCRYSTTPNTLYAAMTGTFNAMSGNLSFYKVITGHQDGTSYTYYVRCFSLQGAENTDDYEITFNLRPTETIPTPGVEGSTAPAGSSGHGGVGPFPDGSDLLYRSTVTVSGWAPPLSTVYVLMDSKQIKETQAQSDGSFSAKADSLERGTYTFTAYAMDPQGRKTAPHSETLDVSAATNNYISEIVLSPTISLLDDSINPGEDARLVGEAVPGSTIEIMLIAKSKSNEIPVTKTYIASTTRPSSGSWTFTIPALDTQRGTYFIKARATHVNDSESEYSKPISLGVGEQASGDLSNRSDINKDDKVNLVDFSILLSAWGQTEGDADINEDGRINLADVSILLFNWTG